MRPRARRLRRPLHHRQHDPAGGRRPARGDRDHAARRRVGRVHPLAVHLRGRVRRAPGGRGWRSAILALARRSRSATSCTASSGSCRSSSGSLAARPGAPGRRDGPRGRRPGLVALGAELPHEVARPGRREAAPDRPSRPPGVRCRPGASGSRAAPFPSTRARPMTFTRPRTRSARPADRRRARTSPPTCRRRARRIRRPTAAAPASADAAPPRPAARAPPPACRRLAPLALAVVALLAGAALFLSGFIARGADGDDAGDAVPSAGRSSRRSGTPTTRSPGATSARSTRRSWSRAPSTG